MARPARAAGLNCGTEFVGFAVHVRMMFVMAVRVVAMRVIVIERCEPARRVRGLVEIETARVQHFVERHVAERRPDLVRARVQAREDVLQACEFVGADEVGLVDLARRAGLITFDQQLDERAVVLFEAAMPRVASASSSRSRGGSCTRRPR